MARRAKVVALLALVVASLASSEAALILGERARPGSEETAGNLTAGTVDSGLPGGPRYLRLRRRALLKKHGKHGKQ